MYARSRVIFDWFLWLQDFVRAEVCIGLDLSLTKDAATGKLASLDACMKQVIIPEQFGSVLNISVSRLFPSFS